MTTTEFIRIKLTGKVPQFKDLAGLQESGKTSTLLDFVTMLHPNCSKEAQGSSCKVITARDHYHFTIYNNCIVKTQHLSNAIKRTLYTL